jgi:cell division transport system ATP-binding protein
MITFGSVCKRYPGGVEALRGVSLAVDAGEMVYITGHSGAGKSTVVRLIAGIERASSGTVIVHQQNVAALGLRSIPYLRRKLGLVLQDQKLLFDRSTFENVMLPLAIAGVEFREASKRVRAALDKVGLLGREKSMPITLSGGEQQRLAIARAVVNRPTILLADEPTGNLDAAYAREIFTLFRSFNQVGPTVVIATHDTGLIAQFPARQIGLHNGLLVS